MAKPFDLPDVIPVFPLPGALLLPRARLPLHIFEPRYLAMLDDVLKVPDRLIGMVQPVTGRDTNRGPGLHTIGCAGRVTQFSETEDGRYMITLCGISRFRVTGEVEGFAPYRRVRASWDGFERDQGGDEADPGFDRDGLMNLLSRYFSARGLSTDWESLREADDELLINSLSMLLDFDTEDKQALLEAPCLTTRRETLMGLLEYALRGGAGGEVMQ
ncbi:LON peptidase substrate-binding domain-containing protein [Lutimaribacter sp. EGI FJ00015]|uniref:LON peptidase substrate-binding domain-containing protein n=1 Tax=Lutimaribacter degradans TaxID=2945989 RepID=A0ACC5ZXR0_9RHOB|nr:LON peptidase substrate-binding domain-containing protein [Lutimaribacter sp. EGI FJ00013]MCM2562551.1 LON peptidase substrate-binding domain-containing protein [Lutimaribacter sp. EGI FJ00013]MCO0613708.1 LON peptidase substrate-binding domain-containing protein [Lutimaribacter sp. EGI FJ00015]MCO0636809.1 LON peptidase substrate-binding domain-containing protein [Lutimaribacter sp. EGI FJ00014]